MNDVWEKMRARARKAKEERERRSWTTLSITALVTGGMIISSPSTSLSGSFLGAACILAGAILALRADRSRWLVIEQLIGRLASGQIDHAGMSLLLILGGTTFIWALFRVLWGGMTIGTFLVVAYAGIAGIVASAVLFSKRGG